MKRNIRGFTLVEILIVVIILGILAAIVIPQFTNASNDARNNSVASTLQTARSQIELFKIQHGDTPPAALWTVMLNKSTTTEVGPAAGAGTNFGPYLQQAPTNPLNGQSAVGTGPTTSVGWVYTLTGTQYTLSAVDTAGGTVMTY
jgi:general secretion pathway protein G